MLCGKVNEACAQCSSPDFIYVEAHGKKLFIDFMLILIHAPTGRSKNEQPLIYFIDYVDCRAS